MVIRVKYLSVPVYIRKKFKYCFTFTNFSVKTIILRVTIKEKSCCKTTKEKILNEQKTNKQKTHKLCKQGKKNMEKVREIGIKRQNGKNGNKYISINRNRQKQSF